MFPGVCCNCWFWGSRHFLNLIFTCPIPYPISSRRARSRAVRASAPKQTKDVDMKAAKRARDKAKEAANSGVGILQSFFFNKRSASPASAAATTPPPSSQAGARNGRSNGHGKRDAGGRPSSCSNFPASRFANGGPGAGMDEETYRLIEVAVPTEFAGRNWEGYLHHVDFIVALMHVGTSLIPKSLMKVCAAAAASFFFCVGRFLFFSPPSPPPPSS